MRHIAEAGELSRATDAGERVAAVGEAGGQPEAAQVAQALGLVREAESLLRQLSASPSPSTDDSAVRLALALALGLIDQLEGLRHHEAGGGSHREAAPG